MFRLEKLEISGFKSFADRTSLVFGEGITGVVGPNGCGKSNIAEAISWVLGEQSAKNLRGGKMEDVIFNGTRDRKPTGMAEVLLTLVAIEDIAARETEGLERDDEQEYEDALTTAEHAADAARSLVQEMTPPETAETDSNSAAETGERIQDGSGRQSEPGTGINSAQSASDLQPNADGPPETGGHDETNSVERKRTRHHRKRRTIAISAGERVTVGRRLYRTGDSDYLINGRACLLRDIQDLFAGTGLGGAHYAIIEQGRIGQILSSKPLDRRSLIEEAAGITKFKSRKRSTELKLESAKQNLSRLNDIITEVERQLNSLKRQAQKARRYRRLREEMRSLLKVIFTADYYRLNEATQRIAREFEQAELEQRSLDARLLELEAEHRAASAQARSAEDNLTALRERAAAIELEADRARNRRAFEEQQIGELTTRIEELNRDQQTLDERLALLDAETQRQATALQELESELESRQADLLAREATYQDELARLRNAETEIDELRRRMLTEIAITERFRNLGLNLEDAVKRLDLKRTSLGTELERASMRLEEASSEFARAGGEVEGDARTLSEMNERIVERGADLIALREQATTIRSELDSVRAMRDAAAHRLKSLEDLDSHRAYYSDAVQQVLSREQAARINALGTLADFVEVDPQYEQLIESLFARELQSVLVPTIDDALAGVEYIKQEGLGRGAFLVVGLHGGEDDSDTNRTREEAESFATADDHASNNGIEDWLVGPGDTREVSPFQEQYIPEERQLAAADPTVLDAIVIHLHGDDSLVISDSHVEIVSDTDDRKAARRFDEDDVSHASRFQLEVLRAIDLLGIKPQIKTVVERAFSEKCAAAVSPDIEAALQLSIENPSVIYVTLAGEQVAGGRLIVTGAQAGQKGTSLLGLKREIKELREQSKSVAEDENRILKDNDEAQQRLRLVEAEAAALDQQLREHEKTAAARNSHLEGLARDLERAESHVRVVESELEQNSVERRELESRIEQLTGELASAEASSEAVQQSLEHAGSEFAEMRIRVEDLSQQASSVRASAAALAERLNAARAELRRAESEAEELRSRINRNRLELYDSHGRIEALTTSLEESVGASARLERDQASLVATIAVASEELTFSRMRTDELEKTLGELRQASAAAHDHRGHIEVERARIESEAAHLTKTCFAELAMSLEDVVTSVELTMERPSVSGGQLPAESEEQSTNEAVWSASDHLNDVNEPLAGHPSSAIDADSSRARYDELRVKIDEMGPVNMMALEELEESDQRFRFLTEQRRDILDSIKMTEEALAEIKRRSRERFRHAFVHINENFQRMFVELFGGGRGEMTLIDEDDVLESGIDLIAQPPGKRLQNVLLLSGGEKAMAALALVLAIFQYRPSPFCILDEVDAPLDEVNVGRFADKVIEMSCETQFLVITHNKRTMEAARALYGVTMEELGVSKLVSVKFD